MKVGNLNVLNDKKLKNETFSRRELKSLFRNFDFKQFINSPTRISMNSKSLIDIIASNCPRNISESGVITTHLSDHELVYCVRKINWKKAPAEIKTFRNYANYSPSAFCMDLKSVDWSFTSNPVGLSSCVDDLWNLFKTTFVTVADRHAPVIQRRVRGMDNCPWLNNKIKLDMRQRDYLLKRARKTNHSEDWANYRLHRNRVTKSLKKAKSSYNRQLIDNCGNDHRAFWKTMKKILPGEKKDVSSSIRINETLSSDKTLIANAFNKFFTNTVNRLTDAFTTIPGVRNQGSTTREHPAFQFEKVSQTFVSSQLRRLQARKAVGLDSIPARLLIDSADIIAGPLTVIINKSLTSACVPQDWKAARVLPIFKKGKADDMDNYRPISILPVLSKILERAVHQQLYRYLQRYSILSPYQCGFRKSYSTEFAALSLADTIRRNIDQGRLTGAVFIDLRKAFDTVDHTLLLNKLSSVGILDGELDWFKNYLCNRKQIVEYQGVSSDTEFVSVGVPQGSILGPLLFILHINDLPGALSNCSVLMYADDTVLYCSDSHASSIEYKLNQGLQEVNKWLGENSLFLNAVKTEAMLFGTSPRLSNVDNFNILVNGVAIKRVSKFKYLGVIFDERLSWNDHVKYILTKAGSRIGMLNRIRSSITSYSANVVYTSLIRPILEYCDTVWGTCGEGNNNLIERLQNRASRIVLRTSSSVLALKQLKWPTLKLRREEHTFNLVNKCIKGHCPQYFNNYFTLNNKCHSRSTRQSNFLHLPKVRTETAKKSFYYHGCIVFNSLSKK